MTGQTQANEVLARAELVHREFTRWFQAQDLDEDGRFERDDMGWAFAEGMDTQAAMLGKRFFHLASELENEAAHTPSREAAEALRHAAQRIRKELDDEAPAAQPAPGDAYLRQRIESFARGLAQGYERGSRTRMAEAKSSIARVLRDMLAGTAGGQPVSETAAQPAPRDLLYEAFELIANAVPFEPRTGEQWERRKREWVDAWHATLGIEHACDIRTIAGERL